MKRRMLVSGILVGVALLIGGGVAVADPVSEQLELYSAAFDMIWLVLAAALVFFMQAGFAMVETGLTRAKNAGNILMKNLMDFSAGAIAYWAIGWALMYGSDAGGFIGSNGFFLAYNETTAAGYTGAEVTGAAPSVFMAPIYRDWIFQVVFAATAATIVSGAMAERTKFSGYLVYSVIVSAVIYPIAGHWHWGGGWLAGLETPFHDYAGSTLVHSLGGWLALSGAIVLGARKGKYVKVGNRVTVKAIQGHNMPLAALGVFILWFGWFGFNAGSTLSGTDLTIGHIATTTTLSAAIGAVAAMVLSWILFKKPDPSMSLNGALAGLVGITAGTAVVNPLGAVIIGALSGIIVVLSVEFIDKVLHVDDPVGAISVHGVVGAWGTIAVGLFADGVNDPSVVGLFYGGGAAQLGTQLLGVVSYLGWALGLGFVMFLVIKKTIGLRADEKEELMGLDISEHGSESYSGFQIFSNM